MKRSQKATLIVALLAVVLAALILIFRQRPRPGPTSGKLVVHFLDIGQGDSELIELPDAETILIDSGDRGAPTVDLLQKYGVKQIDLMIATHPHSDHIGEMRDVMRSFKVQEFWDSGFNHPTKTYADMLQEIKDRGIKFATPRRGDFRKFGDVSLEVLSPTGQFVDENPNNASVVVRLTFGSRRFLFTGDAETPAWGQMIASEKDELRADLLKAAHHGSSNGTTRDVLDAVKPSIFTISCAPGNDYHHPHPKVMRMLEEARDQIKVYRTDLEGTITAECDGNNIEMSTDKQVDRERLYLTGDEVAGTVASDGREAQRHSRREGRRSR
ncbi:MAG TPA: MBL fold metallo-hydrolase [Blastocatellia bacterium]